MLQTSSSYSALNKPFSWIRRARIGDIPTIYRIESKSFKDPYSSILLMNLLALYPEGFLVAENEREIIGYTIVRTLSQKGHIIALAVAEGYRNGSVGTRLLSKAVEFFKQRGMNGAWLEVRVSNLLAQRFYLGRGFERLKKVEGYYGDGEDAEILYMPLSS
jgi:ribosomal-protein-alanine N-acetyltransferase